MLLVTTFGSIEGDRESPSRASLRVSPPRSTETA